MFSTVWVLRTCIIDLCSFSVYIHVLTLCGVMYVCRYVTHYDLKEPCDDIYDCLDGICKRIGALSKGL